MKQQKLKWPEGLGREHLREEIDGFALVFRVDIRVGDCFRISVSCNSEGVLGGPVLGLQPFSSVLEANTPSARYRAARTQRAHSCSREPLEGAGGVSEPVSVSLRGAGEGHQVRPKLAPPLASRKFR